MQNRGRQSEPIFEVTENPIVNGKHTETSALWFYVCLNRTFRSDVPKTPQLRREPDGPTKPKPFTPPPMLTTAPPA